MCTLNLLVCDCSEEGALTHYTRYAYLMAHAQLLAYAKRLIIGSCLTGVRGSYFVAAPRPRRRVMERMRYCAPAGLPAR